MPLQYFTKALLRPLTSVDETSIALDDALKPLLLTPRSATEKYQMRISKIISGEHCTEDAEERLLWFVLRYDKPMDDREDTSHDIDAAEEKRTQEWLEHMETREYVLEGIRSARVTLTIRLESGYRFFCISYCSRILGSRAQ